MRTYPPSSSALSHHKMWTLTGEQRTAASSKGFLASVLESPALFALALLVFQNQGPQFFLGIDFLPLIAVLEPAALSHSPGLLISEDGPIRCALVIQQRNLPALPPSKSAPISEAVYET